MKPFDDLRRTQESIRKPFDDLRRIQESIRNPFDDLRRTQAAIESVRKPTLDWQKQLNLFKAMQVRLEFPYIIRGGLPGNLPSISIPARHSTPLFDLPPTSITVEVYEEFSPEIIPAPSPELAPITNQEKVFMMGGNDKDFNNAVARFVERLGFNVILFDELPNGGRTRIEKLKACMNLADFAIVLLTPDDVGASKDNPDGLKPRPSQDIIFALSHLLNELRPERVCTLCKKEIELPSYIGGQMHVMVDGGDDWKLKLVREIRYAGLPIDLNKLL